MLIASQFQGFCRDLHMEAVRRIAASVSPPAVEAMISGSLARGRQLDVGNAHAAAIGADFGRFFSSRFWAEVDRLNARLADDRTALAQLQTWRNAIAHQDFSSVAGRSLSLPRIRSWRRAVERLAVGMDEAVARELARLFGSRPW